MKLTRIPTGIESLDLILQGGPPSGSLILLIGQIGAGDFEFTLTSAARLLMMRNSSTDVPGKVAYISFTRSKEDIVKEIAFSFPEYYKILHNCDSQKRFEFMDFSEAYFARSFIPVTWRSSGEKEVSFESLKWSEEQKNLIQTLSEYLDRNANKTLVIIDSLTALAQYCLERMEWNDLILFLRGLQKISKKWNGLVYMMLGEGIFDKRKQEEISDCADGVMVFEWEKLGASQRQRVMYLKKFRGILPGLCQDNIVNFEIHVSSRTGFEVSNIKRVRGR